MRTTRLFILVLSVAALCACIQCRAAEFEPVGLGGGGGLFSPAASPHDPNLMFVACDMGGLYRSTDGGRSWLMLDKRQMRSCTSMSVVFHPTDPGLVYGWGCGSLRVSRDRGLTWTNLARSAPWHAGPLQRLAIDRQDPLFMVAGGDGAAYSSRDGGDTWSEVPGVTGSVVGAYILPDGPVAFIGTDRGVFRSEDHGASWKTCNTGLPVAAVRGLCGGCDTRTGASILYCTVPSSDQNGQYVGGVFRSEDRGASWQSAMNASINTGIRKEDPYGVDDVAQYQFIAMDETRPSTVWVTTRGTGYHPPKHWTVYRSDDAGANWRYTFTGDPHFEKHNVDVGWVTTEFSWGWGGPAVGFNVCDGNPDVAIYTNAGELFITTDGGQAWHNGFCHPAPIDAGGTNDGLERAPRPGSAWLSTGLNVTSCWEVVFDPFVPNNVYIGYTDIGFAHSEDRGKSWTYSARGSPWGNTFYRVVCDPVNKGVLYAACSNQHDIPTWTSVDRPRSPGGVCISHDDGKTWERRSTGLPALPCTSIALDPKSPPESRTLYAAMFGDGIYKSTDGGGSWTPRSQGLGSSANRHVYSVRLHPDGTLFCSITGQRTGSTFSLPSGLWRSGNGGASWESISDNLQLRWAGDFDFDPADSKIIYLAASTAPGYDQGGIYKTTDGGATWREMLGDRLDPSRRLPQDLLSYSHCFFVKVDEQRPQRVYMGPISHGLFISEDAGETWKEALGIPFGACTRVTIDPQDRSTIWVATFGGGVWKGKLE